MRLSILLRPQNIHFYNKDSFDLKRWLNVKNLATKFQQQNFSDIKYLAELSVDNSVKNWGGGWGGVGLVIHYRVALPVDIILVKQKVFQTS